MLSKQDELKKIKKLNPEDNYSDEDILVQFFTLLMAGASTTGLTLSWAFYYLGNHHLSHDFLKNTKTTGR